MTRTLATIVFALLAANTARAGEVTFTQKPVAQKQGEAVTVAFGLSAPADVEVAVLDAKGAVVRHLAARRLTRATLSQRITWDGKDDVGRAAAGGPFRVRVRAGSAARLERIVGWDPQTIAGNILAVTVGPGGELFVLYGAGWGRSLLSVFDRNGRYLRTILPYPAETPAERTKPAGHLEVDDPSAGAGARERLPMVFSGHSGSVLPLTSGMRNQTMAWHPKGHLLLAGAVGTMAEHGPPRHLLAMHPRGGAPEGVRFVGPQIRMPIGFMGGAGEASSRFFDHLAVSPDGDHVYFVPCKMGDRRPRHALFRLKWTDAALAKPFLGQDRTPGADDAHFNDPQGVAVGADGSLYVCDRGNNRVMRFSAGGKLLGKLGVNLPDQIAVHPKTGVFYVLSRGRNARRRDRWAADSTLRKFSAWGEAPPTEVARLDGKKIMLMALDAEASPPRLWTVAAAGWSRQSLAPVTDKGASLELGPAVNRYQGLRFPMFLAADPARRRILVREMYLGRKGLRVLDLKTGEHRKLGIVAADLVLDQQGNIYTMDGYRTNSLSRYTPAGKPLPFKATGSHKLEVGPYRGYGPDMGLQGHCVDLQGNIYVIRSSNYGDPGTYGARVDVFGPDGTARTRDLIDGLGYGDCGLAVDPAGNVYVGANVKKQAYPQAFMSLLPQKPWAWWRRGKRPPPWHYMFMNPYLFYWGSVFKFPPKGGAFYGHPYERKTTKPIPAVFSVKAAPKDAVSYRSAYLGREIKVAGAMWSYQGVGIIPSSSDGPRPDPGCVCLTSRLAVDRYGRVFAPDVFRFSVQMLDTDGRHIARIGRYGNTDDRGPDIRFAWPAFVSVAGDKLYVCDSANGRVSIIRFDYAAESVCEAR